MTSYGIVNTGISAMSMPNHSVKALPSVAGTRQKRRAPYLYRYAN